MDVGGSDSRGSTTAWAVGVVVLLAAIGIWRWLAFGAPNGGDWAQYMSHARALAEGRPYGEIGYLFSPAAWIVGPPIYPPGLPILLAPAIAIFGESTLVPRLLMHVLLGVFLWSAYRYFARDGEPGLALGMTVVLGTGFLLSDTANVSGADLGMCAFIWLVFVFADRKERWTGRAAVLIGAIGVLAILFRIAALPLVPAAGLWALLRWRRGGLAPWVVTMVWAATLAWVLIVFGPGGQATQAFSIVPTPSDLMAPEGGARFISRLAARLATYRHAISETYLYPFPIQTANRIYHLLAVPFTLLGLWGWVRPRWTRFGVLYGALTLGMLMTLPVWTGRYAWVLTPFICYGLVRGVAVAGRRFVGWRPAASVRWGVAAGLTIAILAASNVAFQPSRAIESDAEDWRAMGRFLTGETPRDSLRAASNRPRVMTWYTRIPAAGLPIGSLDVFLADVQRLAVTRVVVSRQVSEENAFKSWERWKGERPELFRLLHTEGELEAYEIVRPAP